MTHTTNYVNFGLALSENLLLEANIPKLPEIATMVKDPKITKLINISKSYFKNKQTLTNTEEKELGDLFEDEKVKRYLAAATKVGRRIGWIRGSIAGIYAGGAFGAAAGLASASISGVLGLALLGAIAGGLSIGFLASRIMGVLNRWETERKIASGGAVRVHT